MQSTSSWREEEAYSNIVGFILIFFSLNEENEFKANLLLHNSATHHIFTEKDLDEQEFRRDFQQSQSKKLGEVI